MSGVNAERDALLAKIGRYKWYHRIRVTDDLYTEPAGGGYPYIWNFIAEGMERTNFTGAKVLDVGCRDGLFSFEAERRGAREIVGIDNDISAGATELLIPLFRSGVRMYRLNLYDLTPDRFGRFDVVLLFGVLYHLRYPFWGLKRVVDCLSEAGTLLIESGMLVDKRFEAHELLYCPVEASPYERTSCTFFNAAALTTTLHSFGCRLVDSHTVDAGSEVAEPTARPQVTRQFFRFEKQVRLVPDAMVQAYWNRTHEFHTRHGH